MSNREFNKNFRAILDRCQDKQRDIVRGVAMELLTAVTLRSPVDTGRFRANWQANIGSPDVSTTDETETFGRRAYAGPGTGEAVLPRNADVLARFEPGQTIYLTNSLPYARALEFGGYPNPPKGGEDKTVGGYSKQAPGGMVRVTVSEYAQHMARVLEDIS